MVEQYSIYAFQFNIIICFGLPAFFILYLLITRQRAMKPVFVGALVFIVSQLLLRIPIMNSISQTEFILNISKDPWLYALYLGLSAALFEEIGRLLGFTFALKKNRFWIDAFAFGVGHASAEAISLVGITNINNYLIAEAINNGTADTILASIPKEQADLIVAQLLDAQFFNIILGGIERVFTLFIHIGLTILVLRTVKKKNPIYLILAIILHTLINMAVVILPQVYGYEIYEVEIYLAGVAVVFYFFIVFSRRLIDPKLKKKEKKKKTKTEPVLIENKTGSRLIEMDEEPEIKTEKPQDVIILGQNDFLSDVINNSEKVKDEEIKAEPEEIKENLEIETKTEISTEVSEKDMNSDLHKIETEETEIEETEKIEIYENENKGIPE